MIRKSIAIMFVVIILACGCHKKEAKEKVPSLIPVRVQRVEVRDLEETLEYTGNIKAQDEAIVYPKVSGKIIEKIKEDGSFVEKGEPLLYIDRDEVGLKFEKAPVESPLTGVVGRVFVDNGQHVNAQTQVALVVNMDKVKIGLDIPEIHLPRISLGKNARISLDAYPDEVFIGQVSKISPVLDLATRAAPAEITVDNPKHILNSGMFAKVNLILTEHKGVSVILKEGIIGREPDLYVFVIKDKKAALRKITLGIRQGQYYEVTSGLKEGDLVVILGQQRLREGSEVITEEQK
ncbi:MAG: efflux RND transporter periplasmic adaptor subunit [Candidatus Omnitrophota bacterium]